MHILQSVCNRLYIYIYLVNVFILHAKHDNWNRFQNKIKVRHSWKIDNICVTDRYRDYFSSSNRTSSGTSSSSSSRNSDGNSDNDGIASDDASNSISTWKRDNYLKLAIPDTSFLVYYHWKSYYLYYAEFAKTLYAKTIIVKMDDDAVYMDIDNFENFIRWQSTLYQRIYV